MVDAVLSIHQRVEHVRSEAAAAARACGRSPSDVAIMAVVKTRKPADIVLAAEEGLLILGENRVQEGLAHIDALPREVRRAVRLHFIGRLQSNKARKAVLAFDSIDSVDSESLAARLSRIAGQEELDRDVMIEVNLGLEDQKGGVAPDKALGLARLIAELPHLDLTGLMGIPPFSEDPENSRPYFRRLAGLFHHIRRELPNCKGFKNLSMGMSNDFKVAIEEGATLIRIGTALFGARRSP